MPGAGNKTYEIGHEYDLGNGSLGVWGGPANGFMDAQAYLALKQQRAMQFDDVKQGYKRLSEALPMTEPWDATGAMGGFESGEGAPAWSPIQGIGGTAGYNLNRKLTPVRANATIQNMLRLKGASPTGSTGFGSLDKQEGVKLESTDATLDTRQSKSQLQAEIRRAQEAMIRHTPGLHQSNPIDLATMNPTDIPDGAYFKGPDGRIYSQKRGAGWPKAGAGPPDADPRATANRALRSKSGLPVLLGVDPPGGD